MSQWLYQNLKAINKDQPEKHFANSASVLWLRALAIMVQDEDKRLSNLQKISVPVVPDSSTYNLKLCRGYESLFKSYQNYNSLSALCQANVPKVDIVRTAIINWYYTIYYAGRASIYTKSIIKKGQQDSHGGTANKWASQFAGARLNLFPFSLKVSGISRTKLDHQISKMKGSIQTNMNSFHSQKELVTLDDALSVHLSYLNGTAKIKQKEVREQGRSNDEYQLLQSRHEKTQYLNAKCDKHNIAFLHLAYRFRVKTHYKDAFFFGYGDTNMEAIEAFVSDLELTSRAFLQVAARHIKTGFGDSNWNSFMGDMEFNNKLSTSFEFLDN